jgi:hypothetical protein
VAAITARSSPTWGSLPSEPAGSLGAGADGHPVKTSDVGVAGATQYSTVAVTTETVEDDPAGPLREPPAGDYLISPVAVIVYV